MVERWSVAHETAAVESITLAWRLAEAEAAWHEAEFELAEAAWLEAGVLAQCLNQPGVRAAALLLEVTAMVVNDRPVDHIRTRLALAERQADTAVQPPAEFTEGCERVRQAIEQRKSRAWRRWLVG